MIALMNCAGAGEELSLDGRIDSLAASLKLLRVEVRQRLDGYNAAFHPRWGQVSSLMLFLPLYQLGTIFTVVQSRLSGVENCQTGTVILCHH